MIQKSAISDPNRNPVSVPGEGMSTMTKRHLLIAGTGRAGTTFLVQYLHALGLETHLSRPENRGNYDQFANAGFEDTYELVSSTISRPYVMKSPWLYEFVDKILMDKSIEIDAVIIPIRDIVHSAQSRIVNELATLHRRHPWMKELERTWGTFGSSPGGVISSLNPVDQGRLLALEFYRLIEKLAAKKIRIILLHFPEMITDSRLVYEELKDFLPDNVTEKYAVEVHRSLADAAKIRTENEVADRSVIDAADETNGAEDQNNVPERENQSLKVLARTLEAEIQEEKPQIEQLRAETALNEAALINAERAYGEVSNFWREQVRDALDWSEKQLEQNTPDVIMPLLVRHFKIIAGSSDAAK